MDARIRKGLSAKRESKYVEFKTQIDWSSPGDRCEIVKDIVAIANSGGGVIIVAADDKGKPTGDDVTGLLAIDPADIDSTIHKYTSVHLPEVAISRQDKDGHEVAAIVIGAVDIPVIFTSPGTYPVGDRKQKTAFGVGTVYFRHGAKSEPGDNDDIRRSVRRILDLERKALMSNLRKVVTAPTGSKVVTLPGDVVETANSDAFPIRLTDDPEAPAYRKLDRDKTHPHRQKDVLREVRKRIGGKVRFNQYDMQAVKRVYRIDRRGEFYWKPKFSAPQYSPAYVDWLVEQFGKNKSFFEDARQAYRDSP